MKHISHSAYNLFSMCGMQYYFRYILRKRVPPNINMVRGGSVQKGAEITHRELLETGKLLPTDVVQDCARDEFVHRVSDEGIWLTNEEISEKSRLLNEGLNSTVSLAASYRDNRGMAYKNIQVVEDLLYADIGLDLPICGKPDIIANNINEDLKVTGKRATDGFEHLSLQPTFYKILARENDLADMKKYKSAFLYMIPYKNEPKHAPTIWDAERRIAFDYRITERTEQDELRLKKRLTIMIDMIKAGTFMPCEVGHWLCSPDRCGYFAFCKFGSGNISA